MAEAKAPAQVAIIRLLLYTGARVGEVRDLRWEWVHPPRLSARQQDDLAEQSGARDPRRLTAPGEVANRVPQPGRHGTGLGFAMVDRVSPDLLNAGPAHPRLAPQLCVHRHQGQRAACHHRQAPRPPATGDNRQVRPSGRRRYPDDVIADAARRISGSLAQAIGVQA